MTETHRAQNELASVGQTIQQYIQRTIKAHMQQPVHLRSKGTMVDRVGHKMSGHRVETFIYIRAIHFMLHHTSKCAYTHTLLTLLLFDNELGA